MVLRVLLYARHKRSEHKIWGRAPYWPDNSIWTFAPYCQTATYRSRAELYVTGSWDGKARRYPYVVVSLPVWIECP